MVDQAHLGDNCHGTYPQLGSRASNSPRLLNRDRVSLRPSMSVIVSPLRPQALLTASQTA